MACTETWLVLPNLIKILFVSTMVAFFATILGFATPVWISGTVEIHVYDLDGNHQKGTVDHIGLWHACGGSVSGCINMNKDLPAFYVATRVFACFSLISAFVTTGLVFWYTCLSKGETRRPIILSIVASLVTGGLLLITLAIFGGQVKTHLSFSFAMLCIADILYVFNGVMFLIYVASGRR